MLSTDKPAFSVSSVPPCFKGFGRMKKGRLSFPKIAPFPACKRSYSAGSAARMYSITESLQPSMCTHLP